MSDIFGRYVAVEFGLEGQAGKRFDDLRISFDCKLSRSSAPNEGIVRVYNLNQNSLSILQDKRAVVRLIAGYQSQVPKLIFEGNIVRNGLSIERQGPDRIATMELRDSGRAWSSARLDISFSRSVSLEEVYQKCVEQLGIPERYVALPAGINFPSGIHLSGSASRVLDRIAQAGGSEWWVSQGSLNFVGQGEATEALSNLAPLFSYDLGNLIGAPTRTDQGVQIRALLDPDMRPGSPYKVDSLSGLSGTYIAHDVGFTGDSGYDTPFYVEATGRPY